MKRSSPLPSVVTIGIGVLILVAVIVGLNWLMLKIWPPGGALMVGAAVCALTIYFMHWLGARLDRLWAVYHEDRDGRTFVARIWRRGARAILIVTVLAIGSMIGAAMLTPPGDATWPFELIFSLALAALWLAYMLHALSGMVRVQGDRSKELAEFAWHSLVGAIALSIFLVLPFDVIADGINRIAAIVSGQDPPPRVVWSGEYDRNVAWLQSVAIPTVVSLAFGILLAVATSLVWYNFYHRMSAQGLREALASRRGRDESKDDTWFPRLKDAQSRVVLSGVTLGGWFRNWERFRDALNAVVSRRTVGAVSIVLPEPGNAFFWRRREDERKHDLTRDQDTVARLAHAIERLYDILPNATDTDAEVKFWKECNLCTCDEDELRRYAAWFSQERAAYVQTFESHDPNKQFAEVCRDRLAHGPGGDVSRKIRIIFAKGLLLGLIVSDERIFFAPYLPGVEDKDCPQFELQANSPLGASLTRSLEEMERDGIWVFNRSHIICMAYRFWRQIKEVDMSGRTIPRWLTVGDTEI